jgi:hypothetical protein
MSPENVDYLANINFSRKHDVDFVNMNINKNANDTKQLYRDIVAGLLTKIACCESRLAISLITEKRHRNQSKESQQSSKFSQYFDWPEPSKHHHIDY